MTDAGDLAPLDLDAVRARYDLARMAGTAADDAGQGWDNAKMGALIRSWQDIPALFDSVVTLTNGLMRRKCAEHFEGAPGTPHTYSEVGSKILLVCEPDGGQHPHQYDEPEVAEQFGVATVRRRCTWPGCDHFQFASTVDGPWTDAAPSRR